MTGTIRQIRSVLETTLERWQRLLVTLPQELLARPPAPGEWSALECLGHLLGTEQVFSGRIQVFLSGGESFPAFDPDAQGSKPEVEENVRGMAESFAELRRASLAVLDRATEADLPRVARHAELGPVTLAELLNEWAAHDLMHTVQAERALMQPFIQASGPWQVYFRDHVARTAAPG